MGGLASQKLSALLGRCMETDAFRVKPRVVGNDRVFFSLADREEVTLAIVVKEAVRRQCPRLLGGIGIERYAFIAIPRELSNDRVFFPSEDCEEVAADVAEEAENRQGSRILGGIGMEADAFKAEPRITGTSAPG